MQKIELKKQIQKYPEYKDSGVGWAGEIPLDWSCVPLRRVVKRIKNGTTEEQIEYEEGCEPVTRIETISKGMIDYERIGFIKPKKSLTHYLLKPGDILMSHINSLEMIGNIALFDSSKRLFHGMNLLRLEARSDIFRPWLKYYFKSSLFNNLIKSISKHAINQVSVPINALRSLPCILPTTLDQQKIADYLDAKTAIIDKSIEQKEKLVELLKEKRAAIINRAVTRGLDENADLVDSGVEWIGKVPKGWKVETLKFVAGINRNTLSETTKSDYNLKYIDIGNVNINGVKDEPEELNFANAPSRARRIVQKENTIIGTVRTYLKAIAYFDNPESNLIVSTGFAVLEPTKIILGKFIYYFICSEKFIQNVSKWSTGVSYPAINPSILGCLPTCVPPLDEQQKIIKYLDAQISGIEAAEEKIKKSIELLQEYKSSLIYNVVTGKVQL